MEDGSIDICNKVQSVSCKLFLWQNRRRSEIEKLSGTFLADNKSTWKMPSDQASCARHLLKGNIYELAKVLCLHHFTEYDSLKQRGSHRRKSKKAL